MKPVWRSKTIIFNGLAVLVLIAQQFGYAEFELGVGTEAGIVAIVNLLLRFLTRTAVVIR